MATITILLILIPLVLLNIILFFKVWGMTNNTKRIREILEVQMPDLIWDSESKQYIEEAKD